MKRIAMISEHASPLETGGGIDAGGQNVYVRLLSTHLAALGYSVDVFTRRDQPDLPEVVSWLDGVRVVHVAAGPPAYVRKEDLLTHMEEFTASMRCFMRQQSQPYDILHANFWMSGLVAADLKRTEQVPFVVTFHALGLVRRLHLGESDQFPAERLAAEDRIVREADAIIAECPQDLDDLLQLYHADRGRVTVVPCGIDPGLVWPMGKEMARIVLGLPPDDRILLYAGRLVPRKGGDNVIRGLARLQRDHGIDATLVVVGGDGEDPDQRVRAEYERLREVAEAEGVADRVTFLGHQPYESMKFYYSAADVFVTTPWYEPFGMTPVEAMACGTPVVGSAIGGVKYTVRDGETGYLVPPKDPEALARRLAHLLQHPEVMEQFGRRGIERAAKHFTWSKVTERMVAVYEQAIDGYQQQREHQTPALTTFDAGFTTLVTTLQESQRALRKGLMAVFDEMCLCIERGGKLLVAGNGGSAAQAQHMVAELVGRYRLANRPGLPALALNADSVMLTAWANDVGYEDVFARQVAALGQRRDLLVGISTSGRSRNLVSAFHLARQRGLRCVALLGDGGGDLGKLADAAVVVPSSDVPRVQEVHMLLVHLLCDLIEQRRPQVEAAPLNVAPAVAAGDLVTPAPALTPAPSTAPVRSGRSRLSSRKVS